MLILSLVQNIALLVALSVALRVLGRRWNADSLLIRTASGVLFGVVAIVGMMTPVALLPGVILDGRSIVLAAAGLVGGPIAAGVAATVSIAYRVWLGGSGATVGVLVVLESAAFGVGLFYLRKRDPRVTSPLWLWLFGLAIHAVMVALMFTLPSGAGPRVVREIALPVLLVYPLATALVCRFLLDEEERLFARAEAMQTGEQFRAVFEQAAVGVAEVDPATGLIIRANQRFCDIVGYDRTEITQLTFGEITHPDDVQADVDNVRGVMDGSVREYSMEKRYIRKDGEAVWADLTVSPTWKAGAVASLIGVVVDITDRRRAEEELRRNGERFRSLTDNGRALIWTSGTDGLRDYFNRPWLEFTGRTADQEMGSGWTESLHPDDRSYCLNSFTNSFEHRAPFSMVYRLLRHDGVYRWIMDDGQPRYDEHGEFVGYVGHGLDITEVRESEDALRESEQRYRGLFEANPHPMWVFDTDTLAFLAVNDAAVAHYGYSREEFFAMTAADIRPPEEVPRFKADIARLGHGLDAAGVWRHTRKDGIGIDVEITSHPLEWFGRHAELVLAHDVTERLRAEAEVRRLNASLGQLVDERTQELEAANVELRTANEQLAEANEAKTRFLRSMSHELRTPLNSIIGFSGMLLQGMAGEINDEQHRQLEMVSRAGHHLLDVINGILDLSRIEAGRTELHRAQFDLVPLVHDAVDTVSTAADAKGLVLNVEAADGDIALVSDSVRVRQVLLNLLGNAVKFTDAGTVTVRVVPGGDDTVAISVIDTGPGIPEEDYERVFGEFTQRELHSLPNKEGTGLGLAISRGLATLLGGTLTLESREGEGSTFTLVLPLR